MQAAIRRLRIKSTFNSRYFIPDSDLRSCLDEVVVAEALKSCAIDFYKQDEFCDIICHGALKLFAILIAIGLQGQVGQFIERDGLQDLALDSKLPFRREFALECLEDPVAADEFCEKQWEFIAPLFASDRSHRILADDTVLPFIEDAELNQGSFGKIYKIALPLQHQSITGATHGSKVYVVRKEIQRSTRSANSRTEEHILSALRGLRHPNIIQLIASYTYKGVHNMLFPIADGDLDNLLSQERNSNFVNDRIFVESLYGLSLGIKALHEYFSSSFDLRLIGCHYDLRPKNVLVVQRQFVLADFGLSRLKSVDKGSASEFKNAVGDCTAPECYLNEAAFEKDSIGRASDVWSFGCIIAELVVYMHGGKSGVESFADQRLTSTMTDLGPYKHHSFHSNGQINKGVVARLNDIQAFGRDECVQLSEVVRQILIIDPVKRPRIHDICEQILYIILRSLASQCRLDLEALLTISEEPREGELGIEYEKFMSWARVLKLEKDSLFSSAPEDTWAAKYVTKNDLDELAEELSALQKAMGEPKMIRPLFLRLRQLIDRLWNVGNLPVEVKQEISNDWTKTMLDTEDSDLLRERRDALEGRGVSTNLGVLLAIKRMNSLVDANKISGNDRWLLEPRDVQINEDFCESSLGVYAQQESVLVEWIDYDASWIYRPKGDIGRELFDRIGATVTILHISKPLEFPVLDCIGYIHQPSGRRFGLVSKFPPQSELNDKDFRPQNLNQMLMRNRKASTHPLLGDRFKLARRIVSGMVEFHRVSWVHKTLSAYSVLFFTDPNWTPAQAFPEPYLIGFHQSRQDNSIAFSNFVINARKARYMHPGYEGQGSTTPAAAPRFKIEFEYYTLGLLLLEIGLWTPLDDIWEKWVRAVKGTVDLKRWRRHLSTQVIPALGAAAGSIYRDAVSFCVSRDGFEDLSKRGEKIQRFSERVLEPLKSCRA